MVIKRSAGREILALIAELDAGDEVRREAAIARLAVIGTRAVDRVVAVLTDRSTTPRAAVSALRALESAGDVRALPPALALLDSPDAEIGASAVAVLRTFLRSKHATAVLERLVVCSLDRSRPEGTRLAALDVVTEMGSRVATPVWKHLRDDSSLAVRRRAAKETGAVDPLTEIEAAAAGLLPDEPDGLRLLIQTAGATAPLAALHRLVDVVKSREAKERSRAAKMAWLSARGAVHAALARRDSRVALYDLRETIGATAGPLPGNFVAALTAIGDAASLDAIAAAYARGVSAGPADWLEQLKVAFRTIAARERIGPRHAVMKRIETRWPAAGEMIEKRARTGRK